MMMQVMDKQGKMVVKNANQNVLEILDITGLAGDLTLL